MLLSACGGDDREPTEPESPTPTASVLPTEPDTPSPSPLASLTLAPSPTPTVTFTVPGTSVTAERPTAGDNRGALGIVKDAGGHVVATPSASPQIVAGDFPQARTEPDTGGIQGAESAAVQGTQHTDAMTVVALVNGLPITAAEFLKRRALVSENLAWMRDVVSRIVPDEQVGDRFEGLADPNSLIPESSGLREEFGKRISLVESHGVDTAALASLIMKLSALSGAIESGHSADPAEVSSLVEKQRTDFLYGFRPDLEEQVSTYGFDVFFDEVLPGRIAEELTVDSWIDELIANGKSYEEGRNIIERMQQSLVDTVEVVIVEASVVGTTVRKVIAFAKLDIALTPPPPEPICANGTAVANPIDNRPLVDDCGALLAAKDMLRGTATLDWSADTVITSWEGVTTGGTPSRVTKIELGGESLSGTIPEGIGLLSELTHLDLSQNSLTGDIPEELGRLDKLHSLALLGNPLIGCIPLHWRDIATNDVSSLNLLYCAPPPPENFNIGTPGETSVTASWSAVPGASKYRVEYYSTHKAGVGIGDTLTRTSHTVQRLACETRYQFWVRAQGSGTTYADGWSTLSRARLGTTTECVSPMFDEESYAYELLARNANVGTVTATDPNDDTATYSIIGGNEAGKFAIGRTTGEITVAGSLDPATLSYTLTVEASDGTNTGTAEVEIAE